MPSGIVFDIQRFALHDGPGIRTTVFLKGCPLRCAWCHNPESQVGRPQYSFEYAKCARCLSEGHVCPSGVTLSDGSIVHDRLRIDPATFDLCPHDAARVIGREMAAEAVLAEVVKDAAYYRRSGGGLTISGGEPMAQFDFCLALARGARERGLHVCLDTSGHAPTERFAEILPYVDLFLFDYKETNPARHRELTGVAPDLILRNLAYLRSQGAPLILRCPLVPGVNDSDEHLAGIASLSVDVVEIMPYHGMGNHKAERVGQVAPLAGLPSATDELKQRWLERLRLLGCTQARFGS